MDSTGITPVMNVGSGYGYGDGFGGFGGGMWIFGLLILLGLMNGGLGNGSNSNAIQADVNRGFDNQNLQAQTRDILSAVTSGTAQSVAATNQTFHDTLGAINDKYGELQRDIAALQVAQANALANQNACCCETKLQLAEATSGINANIAQSRYDAALNTEKILSALAKDKIEALQSKVSQLELAQATSNVVRYPNMATFGAGPAFGPFFGPTSCGGINNI